jgi:purine-nucleoside phosphorylase
LLENTHKGMVWTTDALLKETKEIVNDVINKGAIAVDMITSAFLTIANVYKKKATALLVVSDNLITGELGFSSIKFFDAEKKMIDKSFDIIDELL